LRAREIGWFPSAGVAIGSNSAGDYLLFLPSSKDPTLLGPTVYRWELRGDRPERVLDHPFETWEEESEGTRRTVLSDPRGRKHPERADADVSVTEWMDDPQPSFTRRTRSDVAARFPEATSSR